MTGIIGPNGAGKSTIMKLLLRIIPAPAASLFVLGDDVTSLKQRDLARRLAYVPQMADAEHAFTVREMVAMGRYPHRKRLGLFQASEPVVEAALERMDLVELAQRPATELSGGEFQRVLAARALAQDTPVILLDEPTNHLDLRHQLSLLEMLKAEREDKDLTIIAVFHDINLAMAYCNQLLVMDDGRLVGDRTPDELLEDDLLERVYRIAFERITTPQTGRKFIFGRPQ